MLGKKQLDSFDKETSSLTKPTLLHSFTSPAYHQPDPCLHFLCTVSQNRELGPLYSELPVWTLKTFEFENLA